MSDSGDYDALCSERDAANNDLEAARKAKRIMQEKIERLMEVRRKLYDCYDSYDDVKGQVRSIVDDNYMWKGEKYNKFSDLGSELKSANSAYHSNLDAARDAINNAITRLENDIYRQEGIIGELLALINSLTNAIDNFFNNF